MNLKQGLEIKFVLANIDYQIFGNYRSYMKRFFHKKITVEKWNTVNCDYDIPNGIADNKKDSIAYYDKRIKNGVFYKRPKEDDKDYGVTDLEIRYLRGLKEIFDKHHTDYRIVLAPTYDQIAITDGQLSLLNKILGKEHIYNFSGKNKFTQPISNYFESDHYKPYVANEMMKIIYGK